MGTRVPDSWATMSPLHQAALAACRANALTKPADCTCCGCHTDGVDRAIDDSILTLMIEQETCPAERRALTRILRSRRVQVS